MVVIAIIAVLISILLPSLAAVRTQVKVAATQTTLSVLETGVQAFQTDTRCGGSLPPSAPPHGANWQVRNPHTGKPSKIDGASFLLWALAGADLLGTPGFQDLNGDGNWADDTGSGAGGLYERYPNDYADVTLRGRPVIARSGPFVDTAKAKVTPALDPNDLRLGFVVPAARGNRIIYSPCFLDSFDQPILYYRASPNKAFMADTFTGAAVPQGTYNLFDNVYITGADVVATEKGLNFGAGLQANGYHHYVATLGDVKKTPDEVLVWLRDTPPALKRSFAYTIWNPNVIAAPRPYNENSFILLSAGPDGIFGTPDDVANFQVNK